MNNKETVAEEVSVGQPTPGPVPTVGRIVHYKSYGTPNGEFPSIARAAIITAVEVTGDQSEQKYQVSLCVLNPSGMFFNLNVEQGDEPGQWNWPPRV